MRSQGYAVRTPFLVALAVSAMVLIGWATLMLGASLSAVSW